MMKRYTGRTETTSLTMSDSAVVSGLDGQAVFCSPSVSGSLNSGPIYSFRVCTVLFSI